MLLTVYQSTSRKASECMQRHQSKNVYFSIVCWWKIEINPSVHQRRKSGSIHPVECSKAVYANRQDPHVH